MGPISNAPVYPEPDQGNDQGEGQDQTEKLATSPPSCERAWRGVIPCHPALIEGPVGPFVCSLLLGGLRLEAWWKCSKIGLHLVCS